MPNIKVDFNQIVGEIKPFHAINNAPIFSPTDLFHYMGEAGIPYSRLHDTGGFLGGGGKYVDIENIFPDFDADPEDPASYQFEFTDDLLKKICEQGTEPIFRLGASIENNHYLRAFHIFPPKDSKKWARICEGIINHYNHGWANGFEFGITYWEIWNEPDNQPNPEDSPMWKGTKEQYYDLYSVTANHLKEKFPYIKVGGYACCGFYSITGSYTTDANVSERTDYFIEFFHGFMKYITAPETKAPLDFFSWHAYAKTPNNYDSSLYVREQLDAYGFYETESMLNEWNPNPRQRGTEADAANILEMMLVLHHSPLDMLVYYDGQVHGIYNGIFDPVSRGIFPAYYTFCAFNELYQMKQEVSVIRDTHMLPVLAAVAENQGKVLVSNKEAESMELTISASEGWIPVKLRILDGLNGLVDTEFTTGDTFVIPAEKIAIIEYTKA